MTSVSVGELVRIDCKLYALENVSRLYDTKEHADIELIVGREQRRTKAHRLVLACGSSVLSSMLYGGMRESTNSEVRLPEHDPDVFDVLLKFFYTGTADVRQNTVLPLLALSDFYDVQPLRVKCSLLAGNEFITTCRACEILSFARAHGDGSLKESCVRYMLENAYDVFQTDGFLKELPEDELVAIVASDELVMREMDVFRAVVRWGRAQMSENGDPDVSLSSVLANIVPHIRLTQLSLDDLFGPVQQSRIIPHDALLAALTYAYNSDSSGFPSCQPVLKLRTFCCQMNTLTWDPDRIGPKVVVLNDGLTARKHGLCPSVTRSRLPLQPPCYVEIQIDELSASALSNGYIAIGLTKGAGFAKFNEYSYSAAVRQDVAAYRSHHGEGNLDGAGAVRETYGQSFKVKDTIGLLLRSEGLLNFFHNKENLGVAFRGLTGGDYYLSVFYNYNSDQISIVKAKM
ncbi:BTB/POZ domain-containing protein 2-like [Corticium candelabrum]|uniref:BTB/POZ domain-containing protein 2-like n=1 Tax=Corticium candelabrum TaxID=121492 RepID=UPI002E34A620|nr:BTB/POZ domain-containing protein 2-like [Corticium candelabrum]